ncbi:MAG: hypothetical protein AAGF26_07210 [Cyanobacteria bacterium P01_G01_bin.49]
MEKLIDRFSSFNIFTNLFPGIVFCFMAKSLYDIQLLQEDLLVGLFVYYFVGMIISRIGSILVEPILEATKFISYPKYSDFLIASKSDPKINLLLETNNSYRSVIALIFCIGLTAIWKQLLLANSNFEYFSVYIIVIALFFLFLFAYKKQTRYIKKRVEMQAYELQTKDDSKNS